MTTVCFNKRKYSKEEDLKEGKEELKSVADFDKFKIRTGFVKFGYHRACDGEVYNDWNIDFTQRKRKARNEVEVWVIEGLYKG